MESVFKNEGDRIAKVMESVYKTQRVTLVSGHKTQEVIFAKVKESLCKTQEVTMYPRVQNTRSHFGAKHKESLFILGCKTQRVIFHPRVQNTRSHSGAKHKKSLFILGLQPRVQNTRSHFSSSAVRLGCGG